MTHGAPSLVPVEALLSDDPELALVTADMDVWAAAHPCVCEALCECGGVNEHICEICFQPVSEHHDPGHFPARCCPGCPCGVTQEDQGLGDPTDFEDEA